MPTATAPAPAVLPNARPEGVNMPMTPEAQALANQWLALAFKLALRKHNSTTSVLDLDELTSVAQLALCIAAKRYKPEKGVPFGCWAARVIWQRMVQAEISAACPTNWRPLSLSSLPECGQGTNPGLEPVDCRHLPAEEVAAFHEMQQIIARCLPANQVRIVYKYYLEGQTLEAIGKQEGGITKEAIRQTIEKALKRVRGYLRRQQAA